MFKLMENLQLVVNNVFAILEQAHKLRSLLAESERRSEEHREQLNDMMLEKEQMQNDIEQLVQENNRYWLFSGNSCN